MGAQLTTNYSNIKETFRYDIWNIHSATHKTTNEAVSLWIIDSDRFNKTYSSRQEKDQYFDLCLQSIQNIRKLRHPRILKILEVNEKKPDIAFASEPVSSCINSLSEKMHPMDASYISLQVAEVLGFLNQDARLGHLGLSPAAVVLNDEMSVKLIHFQWCSPISQEGLIPVPDKLFSSRVLTEYRFKPPEVLSKKEVRNYADIFIYGLFMYYLFTGESLLKAEQPNEILNEMPTRICNIYSVPGEFKSLLQQCLSLEPSSRPSFLEILQNQAFQSMQLKSLRYLDMILTKDPQDKFKFYKGLATKIDDFSPTLARIKILPILLNECAKDVRFAPVLLSPILKISANFSKPEFMRSVWVPLSFLTTITNPPEVSISLIKNIKQIMEKIDKSVHKDHVYPIIFSALQSADPRIHRECIPQLHLVIEEMNEAGIRGQILPRILDLASNSSDMNIASDAIRIVRDCLSKIDNDAFATDGLPRLAQIWQKVRNASVGFAIVETVEVLKASNDIMMTKAIPIASEILGSHAIEGDVKNRLCEWMISTIRKFKEQTPSDNYSVTKASADADNPFSQISHANHSENTTATTSVNTTASKPKPTTNANADMFSAADIFGPPKKSNTNTSTSMGSSQSSYASSTANNPFTKQSSTVGNIDVFGSSTSSNTNNRQSGIGNIDVFGPSSSASKPKPSGGMDAMDIFGPSPTSSSTNQKRTSYNDTMDIFGSSSTSQQSHRDGNNPFRQQLQNNSSAFNSGGNSGSNYGGNQQQQFGGMGYGGGSNFNSGFNSGNTGGFNGGNNGGYNAGGGGGNYTTGNWNGGMNQMYGQNQQNQMGGNNFYGGQNQQNNRNGQNNNNNDLIGSLF